MLKGRVETMEGEYRSSACSEYEALLEDSVSGEIGGADAVRLSDHLKDCAGCREALDNAAVSSRILRLAEATADPGPGFARGVMARIRVDKDVRAETRVLAAADFDGVAVRGNCDARAGGSRCVRYDFSHAAAGGDDGFGGSRPASGYFYSRSGASADEP